MRVAALLATIILAGCESLLGIEDPSPAADAAVDTPPDTPEGSPDHLTFSLGDVKVTRRQVVRLHVQAVFPGGATSDATQTATYESDATSIATAAAGAITAGTQAGTATITARLGTARAATIRVTVVDADCHVVINELQAGGATSADEWVELYNPCAAAIDLDAANLVYRAAGNTADQLLVDLSGTLPPGELRLFAGPGYTGTNDGVWATGGSSGVLQGTNGGIGLRSGALDTSALLDAVAYGTVTAGHAFLESMSAPALSNARSVARLPFDGKDDNDGSADFTLVNTPTPRARNVP